MGILPMSHKELLPLIQAKYRGGVPLDRHRKHGLGNRFWLLSGFSPYSSLGNVLCLVPMDGGWNYFGTSRGGIHRMPKESVLRIPEMSCGVLEF